MVCRINPYTQPKTKAVNSTETGRRNIVDQLPVTGTRGKIGKWEKRKKETREDFWCLGLVDDENGKF